MTTKKRVDLDHHIPYCPHDGSAISHSHAAAGRILYIHCRKCHCRWSLSGKLQRWGSRCPQLVKA
jgi:formate dehydrogenase maturation protein FdhE